MCCSRPLVCPMWRGFLLACPACRQCLLLRRCSLGAEALKCHLSRQDLSHQQTGLIPNEVKTCSALFFILLHSGNLSVKAACRRENWNFSSLCLRVVWRLELDSASGYNDFKICNAVRWETNWQVEISALVNRHTYCDTQLELWRILHGRLRSEAFLRGLGGGSIDSISLRLRTGELSSIDYRCKSCF